MVTIHSNLAQSALQGFSKLYKQIIYTFSDKNNKKNNFVFGSLFWNIYFCP